MAEFEDRFSEAKSQYFKECVSKTSRNLGLSKAPQVKIWDGKCPYAGDEIAHAHIEKKLICISKGRLNSMTLDEIEETAAHETSHMLHGDHDEEFSITQDNAQLGNWLESHLPVGNKYNKKRVNLKSENLKPIKNLCNYHTCDKKNGLSKCNYCEKYFCDDHVEPRMVLTLRQINRIKEPMRSSLEKEYRNEGGHPDLVFTQKHWEEIQEEHKEQNEKMWRAMDRLKETKNIPSAPVFSELPENIKRILNPGKKDGHYKIKYTKRGFGFSTIKIHSISNPLVMIGLLLLVFSTFLRVTPLTESPYQTFVQNLPQMKENIVNYLSTTSFSELSLTFFLPLSIIICIIGIIFGSNTLILLGGLTSLFYPITFYNSIPLLGIAISITWPFFAGIIGSMMIIYYSFQEGVKYKELFVYSSIGALIYFIMNRSLI